MTDLEAYQEDVALSAASQATRSTCIDEVVVDGPALVHHVCQAIALTYNFQPNYHEINAGVRNLLQVLDDARVTM